MKGVASLTEARRARRISEWTGVTRGLLGGNRPEKCSRKKTQKTPKGPRQAASSVSREDAKTPRGCRMEELRLLLLTEARRALRISEMDRCHAGPPRREPAREM